MLYATRQLGAMPYRRRANGGLSFIAAAAAPAIAGSGPAAPIVAGILGIVTLIGAIFGSHAAAVAKEANTGNAAVATFVQAMQAIFSAANSGQISQAQALAYVDQAVAVYYQQVGSIIKKAGPCNVPANCVWPGGSKTGNTNLDPCNGPCSVGCNFIEPAACAAKAALMNPGTTTGTSTPASYWQAGNGWKNPGTLTFVYSPPISASSITATVATAASSIPSWAWWLGGGLLAAKFVGVV